MGINWLYESKFGHRLVAESWIINSDLRTNRDKLSVYLHELDSSTRRYILSIKLYYASTKRVQQWSAKIIIPEFRFKLRKILFWWRGTWTSQDDWDCEDESSRDQVYNLGGANGELPQRLSTWSTYLYLTAGSVATQGGKVLRVGIPR